MGTIRKNAFLSFRIWFTMIISFLLISLLIWEHFHGGIPSHHLFAKKNLPLISNAWGGVAVPLFVWIMLWRIDKRLFITTTSISLPTNIIKGFIGSLFYSIVLGISIHYGYKAISSNTPWFIIIMAIFFPVYRAEYFLGFVLGLTYWVGGLLPIIVGSVFSLIAIIIYKYVRTPILSFLIRSKK